MNLDALADTAISQPMFAVNLRNPERFWSKVRKTEGCWEWTAGKNGDGYGSFGVATKKICRAHRVSYALANGPFPAHLEVCHKCDNPGCVNPSHLWLGTQKDNADDMTRKGRRAPMPAPPRGETSARSTLTENLVRAIRDEYARGSRQFEIAKRHGLGYDAVRSVVIRRTWRHIP